MRPGARAVERIADAYYIVVDGQRLRCGFTTGSCATLAAKAAALWLDGDVPEQALFIDTPTGIRCRLPVHFLEKTADAATCMVRKDAGDDADVTDGMAICATVCKRSDGRVVIDGGEGIARIRRKGLFGEIGEAAINPVPRAMITKELLRIHADGYTVRITAPDGANIGKKTYNANIGIEGGISIIGSDGIVYPMSEDALIRTIRLEIDQIAAEAPGSRLVLVPGSHGEKMAQKIYADERCVIVSNFVGESLYYALHKGFRDFVLVGHVGKLSKVALGIFQTHNRYADTRMESFVYYLALARVPYPFLDKVQRCLTAEEAMELCMEEGYASVIAAMQEGIAMRVKRYCKREDIVVKAHIYNMKRGFV